MEDGASEYEVEKVLDHKNIRGVRHYLVKWVGYSNEENTWEPGNGLVNCHEVIEEYWRGKTGSKGKPSSTSSRRSSGSDIIVTGKRTASDNNSITSSKSGKRKKSSNDSRLEDNQVKATTNSNHNSDSEDKSTSDDDRGSTKSTSIKYQTRLLEMQAERNRSTRSRANAGNRNLATPKGKGPEIDVDDSQSLTPEKILGATKSKGKLYFMVKWKNSNNVSVVPSEKMNKSSPNLVIQFYEARIVWLQHCKSNDSDDGEIDFGNQAKSVT